MPTPCPPTALCVYLSGPMTGLPNHNYPAFHRAAAALRQAGHRVVNPAEIPFAPGSTWQQCMRADLQAMLACDAIALMAGWERSAGAQLELHVAHRVGLQVLYVDQLIAAQGEPEGLLP